MTKLKFKKKLIIFDLDGVLIDSKINMSFAWNSVKKRFNLRPSFKNYFKYVGKPFEQILKNLNIYSNYYQISKEYNKISINNFDKIKLYKGVKQTLKHLKKKKIKTAIVTSKNLGRTRLLLKKFDIYVNAVQCPNKKLRGKPYPDQILKVIKKMKMEKRNCIYIGDTKSDLIAAQKSKIDFALANYGFKIGIKNFKVKINNISQITKFI